MDKLRLIWNNYNINESLINLQNNNECLGYKLKNTYNLLTPPPFQNIIQQPHKYIAKLYLNSELLQITITYQPLTNFWVFTAQFNPNKIFRFLTGAVEQPTDVLSKNDFDDVMLFVETEILNLGFNLDLKNSKIVEYHFCMDIRTFYIYKHYLPILSQITPPPMYRQFKGRFEDSIYFKSKSTQTIIYDKKTEWNKMNLDNPIDYELVRFEYKKSKISIPYSEFNYNETCRTAYSRLLKLLEFQIQSDDILSYVITYLNSDDNTINRNVTELQKRLLLWFLKSELPKRDINFDDIFIKQLNPSEKVFKSKLKRQVISSDIYDDKLIELHKELKEKLTERFKLC